MDRLEAHIKRRRKQLKLAERIQSQQEASQKLSYESLRADEVYKKLNQAKELLGWPQRYSGDVAMAISGYIQGMSEKMAKRSMTESEYNYLLKNPTEEIFRKVIEIAEEMELQRKSFVMSYTLPKIVERQLTSAFC